MEYSASPRMTDLVVGEVEVPKRDSERVGMGAW